MDGQSVRSNVDSQIHTVERAPASAKKSYCLDEQANRPMRTLGNNEIDIDEDTVDSVEKSSCLDWDPNQSLHTLGYSEIDIDEHMVVPVKSTPNHSRGVYDFDDRNIEKNYKIIFYFIGISAQLVAINTTLQSMDASLRAMNAALLTNGHKVVNVQQDMRKMSQCIHKTEKNVDLILPHFKLPVSTELPAVFPLPNIEELKNVDRLIENDVGLFDKIVRWCHC